MKEEEAIKKIEEQIGQSKIIDYDPITTLLILNKFQKGPAKFRKKEKFITRPITKSIHQMKYHHDFMEL